MFKYFFLVILAAASSLAFAQDPFALGVRETPHRTPDEQRKLFKLPDGFEIQLVASEPEIQKPLNMAFDAKGRLWITDTIEYPYAVPVDKPGRDSIKILEDTNNDGRADKITTFADGLNIPIGVLPYKNGVIAHSIPNIWYFEDTDGDDKCDKRTKLYGPFDHTRDTHGMENAFRRGFDGWIYACHGFNNDSHVKGVDGHEIHLNSGNTFRFRPDGSRIEHYSYGQVNPFGMCFDDKFNIFTADCHSKPITQILRNGRYPSFGKPDDGLGFVPSMMDHLHGSTAICGLVWVDGNMFPQEYRGNFLSGNVMTSRINRNSLVYQGSTITCKEESDFLSTEDPWFRPVDLQIGPDGALYIADFYNRIIGHYEVPLTHPGRDRTSGRIWRVVYTGMAEGTRPAERQRDLSTASVEQLMEELDHPTLTQRLIAADELVHRVGNKSVDALVKLTESSKSQRQWVHVMWVLFRLDQEAFARVLAAPGPESTSSELAQIHVLKALSESKLPSAALKARPRLTSESGFVARAAADALGRHPNVENLLSLVDRLKKTPAEDNHLGYMLRRAIRDTLMGVKSINELEGQGISPSSQNETLAPIALGVPNSVGAAFCVGTLVRGSDSPEKQLAYLTHAARYAEGDSVPRLIEVVRAKWKDDLDQQLQALLAMQQGLAQRGQNADALVPWAESLGQTLLEQSEENAIAWDDLPVPGIARDGQAWFTRQYNSADGKNDHIFFSSLVKGEGRTGIYRSSAFELPEKLSFWCAGHIGQPPKMLDYNYIRLRDAETNELLAESRPPRNDTAQRFEWNLEKYRGRRGNVELVDGDNGGAYAWLAVGRFSIAALNPNQAAQRLQAVAQLAGQLKLKSLKSGLEKVLVSSSRDAATRSSAGNALVAIDPDARAAALVRILAEPNLDTAVRRRCTEAVVSRDNVALHDALNEAMKHISASVQTAAAEALTGDLNGALSLLQLVADGRMSARLLLSPNVNQRLRAIKQEGLQGRINELTATLPARSEEIDRLIMERRKTFDQSKPDLSKGAAVFVKNCATCHQVAGQGQVIGPQLDGIGNRGVDRILEDVLDPNRNVDVAFRTTTFVLSDGRVVSGLMRREEGEQIVVANNQGKEISIAKNEIDEREPSPLSLMPANVAEIVSPEDFQHLIGYLAQQKAKPKE